MGWPMVQISAVFVFGGSFHWARYFESLGNVVKWNQAKPTRVFLIASYQSQKTAGVKVHNVLRSFCAGQKGSVGPNLAGCSLGQKAD